MAAPRDYVPVSFWLPKSLRDRLRRMYPRYGDISEILRILVQRIVDGRLKVK